MARTVKTEWSKPDGWHISMRLERKARTAGRLVKVIEAELAADEEDLAA
jgi:hypothetical protein